MEKKIFFANKNMPENNFSKLCRILSQYMDFTEFELNFISGIPDEQFVKQKLASINNRLTRFLSILEVQLHEDEKENLDQSGIIKLRKLGHKLDYLIDHTTDLWREIIEEE